ncbi:Tim44 domain-containing protein [Methylobacterium nodulans]|uniref:Import inner membrane translocase subunit Tim44 n=1 Tax=Methylobacterium nodulans (strain LMG 21967 / CNCM I-2342 / ORS 2060) TaxID=460265 RepID=B8IRX0_METNO|nr:TIM44-like domain-containing protein [Methylobacterium nodulans]ACL60670.1 import inner membrane translocase subunit Tim44 [Methylobacterium nodulans ORS 2060]
MMTTFTRKRRTAAALGLAALMAVAATAGEARPGGSSSMGSRGSRTYSAPAPTTTAPGMAAPMQRSQATPGPSMNNPGYAQAAPQRRFGGGFFAGLLGAGLLGALLGGGFFGGLGGIASFLGFLLQVALLVGLVMLAVRFFRRRQPEPAMAGGYARSGPGSGPGMGPLGGLGGGGGPRPLPNPAQRDQVGIGPADYDAFERTLTQVQLAYGAEDVATLRRLATPEMVGYFTEELQANAARGVINRISDVKLQQGDLSEAWREGPTDYATVAMRYTLRDVTVERGSGRVVGTGDPEAVEVWTFRRDRGGPWLLSAIQQTR